jgi:hypothetical protein
MLPVEMERMTVCVTFQALTPGYNSHPTVHHRRDRPADDHLSAGAIYILCIFASTRDVLAMCVRHISHRTA